MGDIPFVITDIAAIATVKIEGENIIMFDQKSKLCHIISHSCIEHEYVLPISEVCYLATNYGQEALNATSNQE